MYISTSFVALIATIGVTQAFYIPNTATVRSSGKRTIGKVVDAIGDVVDSLLTGSESQSCPAVWSEISTILTGNFLADGQCTDAARAAIRAAFHDW
jgi:hypothetical protein